MASPVHKRGHAVLTFVRLTGCTPGVKGWDLLRIAVTALAAMAAGTIHAAEPPRPNLLVFLADDLGARDLGCTGSTFYGTPAIDGLAAGGMTFLHGYAASGYATGCFGKWHLGPPADVRSHGFDAVAGCRRRGDDLRRAGHDARRRRHASRCGWLPTPGRASRPGFRATGAGPCASGTARGC